MGFHFPTSCCLISQILFSKITRGKKKHHVQSHEALSKSQESASAALHDARDHWHGQFAEQGTSALQA